MTRLLQLAVILGLGLAIVNESDAKGPKNGGGNSFHRDSRFNQTAHFNQTQRSNRTEHFNRMPYHTHWSSYCWNSHYGCYYYWCPTESCYYYWYAPSCCYLPESCVGTYPPSQVSYSTASPGSAPLPVTTQVTTPIQITNTNQNTLANTNGSPGGPLPVLSPGILPKAP